MIAPPAGTRIWIAAGVTDIRRGFDGLAALVQTQLEADPFSGQIFTFHGRRGDRIKFLCWYGDGLCLFCKRLEQGRFVWTQANSDNVSLTAAQLWMLLEGIDCGRHRVARLMRLEGLRSQTGYRRRPGKYGGKPAVASPNLLKRQFDVVEPNKVWVADITYIRTYEGWLYLSVVLDLFSRQLVGWSMKSQMTSDLAIDALLMAVWRRKPKQEVMVHSDQGSHGSRQFRQRLGVTACAKA